MDFFTLICCKVCIFCLKRPKINEKEAEDGHQAKTTVTCCKRVQAMAHLNLTSLTLINCLSYLSSMQCDQMLELKVAQLFPKAVFTSTAGMIFKLKN